MIVIIRFNYEMHSNGIVFFCMWVYIFFLVVGEQEFISIHTDYDGEGLINSRESRQTLSVFPL